MKTKIPALLCLHLFYSTAFSQNSNLVPNPGFEICSKYPLTWMADRVAFQRYMQFWTSPNHGSPDVLVNQKLPYLRPPRPRVSMEGYKARTGNVMVGLKTYGCKSSVSHCKEYVQVKLAELLIPGEEYTTSCWATVLQNSIKSNHLGMALSTVHLEASSVKWLHGIKPVTQSEEILKTGKNEWVRMNGNFVADSAYQYLLIGNFFPDSLTLTDTIGANLRYSYYMIDDVSLRRVHKYSPFEGERPEPGVPVILHNVYFELDKAELMQSSFGQLDALASWLMANPSAKIEMRGHTDSTASEAHNFRLAEQRASAVAAYLAGKGIPRQRMTVESFGESLPATGNDTAAGRQLNRRVEFVIFE